MLKKIRFTESSIPFALFITCFIAYGIMIFWLGVYWDDMAYLHSYHAAGPLGFTTFVVGDRPFSALFYIITSALFGDNILPYHLLNLFLRFFTSWSMFWFVKQLWPDNYEKLVWVPFLFAVYPGFRQQPIAVIYGLHWMNYLQMILSLGLMVFAVKPSKFQLVWKVLSIVLGLSVFSLEYLIGLELVRPVILWILFRQYGNNWKQRILQTTKTWILYIPILTGYIIWRTVLFHSSMYQPVFLSSLSSEPFLALASFAQTIIQDFFKVLVLPWQLTYQKLFSDLVGSISDLIFWIFVFMGFTLSAIYFHFLGDKENSQRGDNHNFAKEALVIGIWTLLVAGLPFWVGNLQLEIYFPYDRFTLPFIFGVSLIVGGLISYTLRTYMQKIIMVSLILAFAIGWHVQNGNTFRRDWNNLSVFLWQLTTRIPEMEPNTILLTHELPLDYFSDYSLTHLVNWIYAPDETSPNLPYLLFFIKARLGKELQSVAPDVEVTKYLRSFKYIGNTSRSVVFYYSPPGCLRIIDPERLHEVPDIPLVLQGALPLAKPSLIISPSSHPAQPLKQWFGVNKPMDWCTSYEEADLARQDENWERIGQIADAAINPTSRPADVTEYGVYIEGYFRLDRLDEAGDLLVLAYDDFPLQRKFVCEMWSYLDSQVVEVEKDDIWNNYGTNLHCR